MFSLINGNDNPKTSTGLPSPARWYVNPDGEPTPKHGWERFISDAKATGILYCENITAAKWTPRLAQALYQFAQTCQKRGIDIGWCRWVFDDETLIGIVWEWAIWKAIVLDPLRKAGATLIGNYGCVRAKPLTNPSYIVWPKTPLVVIPLYDIHPNNRTPAMVRDLLAANDRRAWWRRKNHTILFIRENETDYLAEYLMLAKEFACDVVLWSAWIDVKPADGLAWHKTEPLEAERLLFNQDTRRLVYGSAG